MVQAHPTEEGYTDATTRLQMPLNSLTATICTGRFSREGDGRGVGEVENEVEVEGVADVEDVALRSGAWGRCVPVKVGGEEEGFGGGDLV